MDGFLVMGVKYGTTTLLTSVVFDTYAEACQFAATCDPAHKPTVVGNVVPLVNALRDCEARLTHVIDSNAYKLLDVVVARDKARAALATLEK